MAHDDNEELQRIRDLVDKDYFAVDQQRDWSNEDIRFCDVDGAMYEDWFQEQFASRPKMEFNMVAQAVHRFNGEWASNRFEAKFLPDDGKTSESDADLLSGLYRKDFRRSSGPEAIDNAVSEMAKGGFGAFRLSTEFVDDEDPENDQQRIIFEPIYSAYASVIFDANAKKYDKSDARHVTYLEEMTMGAAEEEWGCDVSSFFDPPNQNRFNWNNQTDIWIGHFYEVHEDKVEAIVFQDPFGQKKTLYKDDFKDFLDEMADGGFEEISRRKVIRRSVWKTVMAGSQILEEPVRIPGKLLPIIPLYGFRSYVDSKEFWYGLVRKNKDANRLFNMSGTGIAENAATTSKDMPIFTDDQTEGRESQLAEMHLGRHSHVVINQLYDENGNPLPSSPQGVWAASRVDANDSAVMQFSSDYIREQTGGAPQEVLDQNVSGKLFNAVSARVDMNTFTLMDNIAKSVKRGGEVYRSIAGEVHDVERAVNIIKEDGTDGQVNLHEIVIDEETGQAKAINDITGGVFEVIVDTGPAFASRKRETVEMLKGIMDITPPDSPYMAFLYGELIENIDGVGMKDLREFNNQQKLMQGLRPPENEEEAAQVKAAQEGQRNDQADYLQALAEREKAEAQESLSNIDKNASMTRLNDAKTAETIAGIDISRFKAANDAAAQQQQRFDRFLPAP